jgi:aryl-alcohol dehydrogenase-like predicted oxidoreductase
MQRNRLGQSPLVVTNLCLGTMTFGLQANEATSFAIMDRAVEQGIDFFDTAELYPVPPDTSLFGITESIIGRWLQSRRCRDQIILASKVTGPGHGWFRPPVRHGFTTLDRHQIIKACEDSLRRL